MRVRVRARARLHNGEQSNQPLKLGMHDYIADKGLDRASKANVASIRQNLTADFIGTSGYRQDREGRQQQGV
jgi:hypothetical protein